MPVITRAVHDALTHLKASAKPDQFDSVRLIEEALLQTTTGFGKTNSDAAEFLESRGAFAIAEERLRQKKIKHYNTSHDDEHDKGELALAAAWYAIPPDYYDVTDTDQVLVLGALWPKGWAMPDEPAYHEKMTEAEKIAMRMRELEKAGAMMAAEWDRLDRKAKRL